MKVCYKCWTLNAGAAVPILWIANVKSWLTGKRTWCWERLKAKGKGNERGWDGWMATLIQWTWVWANSGRWWRTGKPVELQSMRSQRVRHDWATEQEQSAKKKNEQGEARAVTGDEALYWIRLSEKTFWGRGQAGAGEWAVLRCV